MTPNPPMPNGLSTGPYGPHARPASHDSDSDSDSDEDGARSVNSFHRSSEGRLAHPPPHPFDSYPGAQWEWAPSLGGQWVELLRGNRNEGVVWFNDSTLSYMCRRVGTNKWKKDEFNGYPVPPPPELVEQRRRASAGWNARMNYDELRRSFAGSPKKNYGGLGGDSAAINWALAGATMVSAAVVAGFSHHFLQAYAIYAKKDGAGPLKFKYPYYACQFLFGLSIVTSVLLALYVLWVFFDSRHPMRKAWVTASDIQGRPPRTARGKPVKFPGPGTMSFDKVNRMTIHRLYAERAHIRKMLILYCILLVTWSAPFLITTLADGYITWTEDKKLEGVKIAEICGIDKSRDLCLDLARTGIASAVVTFLLLISLIVTTVSLVARPTSSTTSRR